jgi:hypothetical protein
MGALVTGAVATVMTVRDEVKPGNLSIDPDAATSDWVSEVYGHGTHGLGSEPAVQGYCERSSLCVS